MQCELVFLVLVLCDGPKLIPFQVFYLPVLSLSFLFQVQNFVVILQISDPGQQQIAAVLEKQPLVREENDLVLSGYHVVVLHDRLRADKWEVVVHSRAFVDYHLQIKLDQRIHIDFLGTVLGEDSPNQVSDVLLQADGSLVQVAAHVAL